MQNSDLMLSGTNLILGNKGKLSFPIFSAEPGAKAEECVQFHLWVCLSDSQQRSADSQAEAGGDEQK